MTNSRPVARVVPAALPANAAPALSRRQLLVGVAITGAALAAAWPRRLGAQEATPTGDASPAAGASPVAGTWPRTVTDAIGEVTIPALPVRVVAVSDWYEVDYLLAAGVKPVLYGYTDRWGLGVAPWLADAGEADLERYDLVEEPDLELIAAAQPDLIVTDPYLGETTYDVMQGIAPTVALPVPYSGEQDWRVAQRLVGVVTGTEEASEAAIAETEAYIAAGREKLAPYHDRSVSLAYASAYNGGSLFLGEPHSQEGRLIESLGLTYVPIGEDNSPQSLELLNKLNDVDILLSYDEGVDPSVFETAPGFAALPAVKEGRYFPLSELTARAIFAPTTLSVRYAIDELVAAITATANGEGKIVSE